MKYRAKAWVQTSVKISPEFYDLCKRHQVRFSEAIKVGISILLSERGLQEYDNRLNIVRRYREMRIKASQYAQEASDLKNQMEEMDKNAK